jgi:hypothetical protein
LWWRARRCLLQLSSPGLRWFVCQFHIQDSCSSFIIPLLLEHSIRVPRRGELSNELSSQHLLRNLEFLNSSDPPSPLNLTSNKCGFHWEIYLGTWYVLAQHEKCHGGTTLFQPRNRTGRGCSSTWIVTICRYFC